MEGYSESESESEYEFDDYEHRQHETYTPIQEYLLDLSNLLGLVIQEQLDEWGELRAIDCINTLARDYIAQIMFEDVTIDNFEHTIESVFPETFDLDFKNTFPSLLKKFKSWIAFGYMKRNENVELHAELYAEFNAELGIDTTQAQDLYTRACDDGISGLPVTAGIPLSDDTPFSLSQSHEEYKEMLTNAYGSDVESGWMSAEDAKERINNELRQREQQIIELILTEKLKLEHDFIKYLFKGKIPQLLSVATVAPSNELYIGDVGVPDNCMTSDFMGESPVGGVDKYTDLVLIYTGIGSFDQAICWKLDELEKLMDDPTNIYYECEEGRPPNINDTGTAYVGSTAPAGNSTFIQLPDYKAMLKSVTEEGSTIFYIVPILDRNGQHRSTRAVSLAYLLNLPGSAISGKHCEPQDTMSLYGVRQFVKDSGNIALYIEDNTKILLGRFRDGTILQGLQEQVDRGELTNNEKTQLLIAADNLLSKIANNLHDINMVFAESSWDVSDKFINDYLLPYLKLYSKLNKREEIISDMQEILGTDELNNKLELVSNNMDIFIENIYNNLVSIMTTLVDGPYPHEYIDLIKVVKLFQKVSPNDSNNREIKRLFDTDRALTEVESIQSEIATFSDRSFIGDLFYTLDEAVRLLGSIQDQERAKILLEESISHLQAMTVENIRTCISNGNPYSTKYIKEYAEITHDQEQATKLLALLRIMPQTIPQNISTDISVREPDWGLISFLSKKLGISDLTDQLHEDYSTLELENFEELKNKLDNAHDSLNDSPDMQHLFGILQPIITFLTKESEWKPRSYESYESDESE